MNHLFERRSRFLDHLKHLNLKARVDSFLNEAFETGGSFTCPIRNQSHMWEINLHKVTATGTTDEEAMHNWMRAARALTPVRYIEHF